MTTRGDHARRATRLLDPYKKLTVLRGEDVVFDEDDAGEVRRFSPARRASLFLFFLPARAP